MESVKRCCCFTGHRPEKLYISEEEIKNKIDIAVHQALDDGFSVFISGMSRGVDLWAADAVIKMKDENKTIELICAVPYKGFERAWSSEDKEKYLEILNKADKTEYICEKYLPGCFQTRNRYMVDNSSRVIAVYNGGSGGTKNTVKYAEAKNKEVINII